MRRIKRVSCLKIYSNGRSREVVMHLAEPWDEVGFRLKGERTTHHLPVDWLYRMAVRATVEYEKRRKREERLSRKESKL